MFCAVLHHELTLQADDAKDTAQAGWPCQWIAVSDDSEPTAVVPFDMMPFEVEFDTGMFLRSACMPATHEVYVYCRFWYEVSLLLQFNVLRRCSTDWFREAHTRSTKKKPDGEHFEGKKIESFTKAKEELKRKFGMLFVLRSIEYE